MGSQASTVLPTGSVSQWIIEVRQGDPSAIQKIWERYCARLVVVARRKLANAPRRVADEEDVVQKVFAAFFCGAESGRFENLHNRDNLWRLLVTITERRAVDQIRRSRKEINPVSSSQGSLDEVDHLPALSLPTAEFVEELMATCELLFPGLNERETNVTLLKAQGFTNKEIADKLDVTERTIDRDMKAIRSKFDRGA
jgi:RNA polymerase sigma factor (sigma-70 family)